MYDSYEVGWVLNEIWLFFRKTWQSLAYDSLHRAWIVPKHKRVQNTWTHKRKWFSLRAAEQELMWRHKNCFNKPAQKEIFGSLSGHLVFFRASERNHPVSKTCYTYRSILLILHPSYERERERWRKKWTEHSRGVLRESLPCTFSYTNLL